MEIEPVAVRPDAYKPVAVRPDAYGAVLSPSRITLEYNEKIRPRPDEENAFARASGGDEGIRTLDTVPGMHP